MLLSFVSALKDVVVEPVWNGAALERALSYAEGQGDRVRSLARSAAQRVEAAAELSADRHAVAVIGLYRDAAVLYVAALLVARDPAADVADLDPPGAWDALESTGVADALKAPPAEIDLARDVLSSSDLRRADDIAVGAAPAARDAARAAVEWLADGVEARTPTGLRWQRVAKVSALGCALVVLAFVGYRAAQAPANLALGKTVKASSRYPGTAAPAGLVDGEKTGAYGAHTKKEKSPYLAIDLGEMRTVSKVVVYNRGDSYQGEVVPLILELSKDGKRYEKIQERRKVFTQAKPWTSTFRARPARWVRLRRPKHGYIALTEVEVYE